MSSKFLLLLLCLVVLFEDVICKKEAAMVRVEGGLEMDRKIVTLLMSERLVSFLLEPDGFIVDCQTWRMAPLRLATVKYEWEKMTGGMDVEYLDVELDVFWYARQCTKFIRDMKTNGDQNDKRVQELLDRQQLDKPLSDTLFCTRFHPNHNAEFFDGLGPEDECCRQLKLCQWSVPQFSYMFGYLNVLPYHLQSCECTQQFKECLGKVDSEFAAEIKRLFFDVLNMKCFKMHEKEFCDDYSTWFDTCNNSSTYRYVTVE